jgi:hypothetical protein
MIGCQTFAAFRLKTRKSAQFVRDSRRPREASVLQAVFKIKRPPRLRRKDFDPFGGFHALS